MQRSVKAWPVNGRVRRTGTVALTALALVTAGCGAGAGSGGDVPGVTDDTIKLGTTQPLTGPAAPGYSKISKGMTAWFDHVNENGGINGRQVELIVEDDGYNPTETATKTRELVLKDQVFALVGALGTPTHSSVLDFVRQNKIPDLMVASGSLAWNQPDTYPYTFGWQTDYTREGKVLASYVKDKFPDKTYCAFGQNDDLGADGTAGVEIILGEDSLAAKEAYTSSNTNVAPAIGALQAANCDVVFSFSIPPFTALALGTAAKLGYKPQWVVSSVGADPAALEAFLKDSSPLMNGVIASDFMPPTSDESNSWVKLFKGINDEANPDLPYDRTLQYGYALAYTATQALQAGGEDLTQESLIEAMQEGGFEGPALAPFAYSPDDHSGMTGVSITQIEDLEAESITPVYVTDVGDGPVEEYNEAPAEAPAGGMPE